MIIITGPGRSGTSVIARLYQELGFNPGGTWNTKVNAGLESPDVAAINDAIKKDLGIETLLGTGAGLRYRFPKLYSFGKLIRSLLPEKIERMGRSMLMGARKDVELVQWEEMNEVIEKYKLTLQDISSSHQVVKDPQFCWTLIVWAAVGVQIEQVLVCVRALDSMVHSRFSAGQLKTQSISKAKNSLVYGMGLCMAALHSYALPHEVLQFPGFLKHPRNLYNKMIFPAPVKYERFSRVFDRVVNLDKVHEK